jgi:hypothetical protein
MSSEKRGSENEEWIVKNKLRYSLLITVAHCVISSFALCLNAPHQRPRTENLC